MRTLNPTPFALIAILAVLVLSGIVRLEIGPGVVTIGANFHGRPFYLEIGRHGVRAGEEKG